MTVKRCLNRRARHSNRKIPEIREILMGVTMRNGAQRDRKWHGFYSWLLSVPQPCITKRNAQVRPNERLRQIAKAQLAIGRTHCGPGSPARIRRSLPSLATL